MSKVVRPAPAAPRSTSKDLWRASYDAAVAKHPERKARFSTLSDIPVDALYTAEDLAGFVPERDLGRPGEAMPLPRNGPSIDPHAYVGRGNAHNCIDFDSQLDAQAVLRADPTDPNRLDADRDGIACERNPGPTDRRKVPRLTR